MLSYIPELIDIHDQTSFDSYIASLPNPPVIHDYFSQLQKELFLSSSPTHYFSDKIRQHAAFTKHVALSPTNSYALGQWIYHRWTNTLYHILSKKEYYMLRTIRHRDIITQEEQTKLKRSTIAIAGLSVGINTYCHLLDLGSVERIILQMLMWCHYQT